MSDAWDKRKKESERAYAAFLRYRDLGPQRSLSKVSQEVAKSIPLLKRWSRAWRWQTRVAAWDAQLCRIADDTRRAAVADACDRHTKLAKAIQGKLAARLMSFGEEELRQVGLDAVGRLLDIAVKVERLGLGMPTANLHHEGKDGGPIQIDVMKQAKRRLRDKLAPVELELAAATPIPEPTSFDEEPETSPKDTP